jgi:hypothetical protein
MPISIFLSHPQPINASQTDFLLRLKTWLETRGFLPRTLGVTDYSDAAPLNAIRGLMAESNGLICVALRRSHIATGSAVVRQGKVYREKRVEDQWLTSPWAHIEPAMAYQIGLPILILREAGVLADGVLEKGIIGLYMPEFELGGQGEEGEGQHYLESREWDGVSRQWEQHVRNVLAHKSQPPKLY